MGDRQLLGHTLTQFDVEKGFRVPSEWLTVLPKPVLGQPLTHIQVLDKLGFFWEFWGTVTPEFHRDESLTFYGHKMTVLEPKEWLEFVNIKGLRVGDRVILDSDNGCKFRGIALRLTAQKLKPDGITWLDL